jgi:hypothetical protein
MKYHSILSAALLSAALLITSPLPSRSAEAQVIESVPLPPCPTPPASPGVPPPPILCQKPSIRSAARPGDLCLRLMSEQARVARPDDLLSYQLAIHNIGRSAMKGLAFRVTYPPQLHTLVDASASSPSLWVSELRSGEVDLRLATIGYGQTVTSTLRFRVAADADPGQAISLRAETFTPGAISKLTSTSNKLTLTVGEAVGARQEQLTVAPAGQDPSQLVLASADSFSSHELVSIWSDQQNGTSRSIGTIRADKSGQIAYTVPSATLNQDTTRLVAFGQCSNIAAIANIAATR